MEHDYITEYLKNSGAIENTCNDKDKSVFKMNVNKCLDRHCKRSNKPRLENGKCPKGKSKNKSKNKRKKSTNRKRIKRKSKNQS